MTARAWNTLVLQAVADDEQQSAKKREAAVRALPPDMEVALRSFIHDAFLCARGKSSAITHGSPLFSEDLACKRWPLSATVEFPFAAGCHALCRCRGSHQRQRGLPMAIE